MSTMSYNEMSGLTKLSLKDIAESSDIEFLKSLTPNTKFLVSVYLRWVNAARDPCGRQFIHQAYKRSSPHTQESNSTLAM